MDPKNHRQRGSGFPARLSARAPGVSLQLSDARCALTQNTLQRGIEAPGGIGIMYAGFDLHILQTLGTNELQHIHLSPGLHVLGRYIINAAGAVRGSSGSC